MFKKSITLICFLSSVFIAQAVQAAIIFYDGHAGYDSFSLDTSTNIITGFVTPDDNTFSDVHNFTASTFLLNNERIDWLRWDETKGMTVKEALDKYSEQGWRTSTSTEVAFLLNSFDFGIEWDDDPSTDQSLKKKAGPELQQEVLKFFSLFGATNSTIDNAVVGTASCSTASNAVCETRALILDDTDGKESLNVFSISFNQNTGELDMGFGSCDVVNTIFDCNPAHGVVLVRDVKPFVGDDLGDDRVLQQDQNDFMQIASNDEAYRSLFGGVIEPLSDSRYYLSCHDDTRIQIKSNTIKTNISPSENCFSMPELVDALVIGFYDDYQPSAEVISNTATALAGIEPTTELCLITSDICHFVMQSVATLVKNNRNPLPLIGLGSFVGNTWPGPGELSKNNYDFHFIANKNVARNYIKGGNLIVSSLGIPRPLLDQVKKDLANNGKFIKIDPEVLIEVVLLHVIAGEMGTDRVTNSGPTYLYQEGGENRVASCWASPATSTPAKNYVKEVAEQPLCLFSGYGTSGGLNGLSFSNGGPMVGRFRVEIDGVDAGSFSSCSLILGHVGDILEFTTDPGTTITMFSCPTSEQ